ncbi:synaptic vesicular amine transporter [Ctenocephalides felis]|uniref:synaptic vesicular amine transporter n=1 Tax=Ctenocephalides felis TaxID=7515 RepID=UPI000E6E501E|nr:synaptic vesicular amine transporter [Ctenocephalides felis]
MLQMEEDQGNNNLESKFLLVGLVYTCLLLDNMLLTVIVPILPDFLSTKIQKISMVNDELLSANSTESFRLQLDYIRLENGSVGLLLSAKAIVQLICNPLVGILTERIGYRLPIFLGMLQLWLSSFLFALGETYWSLLLARSIHGSASACLGVAAMCVVAELYPDENLRSRIMGIVLGSIALGVLIGYPFGSFLYAFLDKSAPFYIITVLITAVLVVQFYYMDLHKKCENLQYSSTSVKELLSDKLILIISGAICVSTSVMSILEPCLPIWLMTRIKPKKWQLGTVFLPDSIGYLVGTNFVGGLAYSFGQWKVSICALILVGFSSILIPTANTVSELIWPHFFLGLGIGTLDASLVPLLATLVDLRHCEGLGTHYGAVYALQQMAVSLAYSLAPILGGEFAQSIGFSNLMRIMGILNLMYSPLLIYLMRGYEIRREDSEENIPIHQSCPIFENDRKLLSKSAGNKYTRL